MTESLDNKLLGDKTLIYVLISTDVEVYLDMDRVLSRSQRANISDVLRVSL